jgi:hypothetical protein
VIMADRVIMTGWPRRPSLGGAARWPGRWPGSLLPPLLLELSVGPRVGHEPEQVTGPAGRVSPASSPFSEDAHFGGSALLNFYMPK